MYVRWPREEVDARCPSIDDPHEDKTEESQFLLHTFQQSFGLKFRTGPAVDTNSCAGDPIRLLFENPLEDAIALNVACLRDVRNEQCRHRCSRRVIPNRGTGKHISVMCGDGVSLTRHFCSHGQTET